MRNLVAQFARAPTSARQSGKHGKPNAIYGMNVGIDYAPPPNASHLTSLQMSFEVASLPNIESAPYSFGLSFTYMSGQGAYLSLNSGKYVTLALPQGAKCTTVDNSCSAGHPWRVGMRYVLTISFIGKAGASERWNATVFESGKPAVQFTWSVPSSWGLLSTSQNQPMSANVSYYGPLPGCDRLPYVDVAFDNPTLSTGKGRVTAVAQDHYASACYSNIRFKTEDQKTPATSIMANPGWRPGETPKPSPPPTVGKASFETIPMPSGPPAHDHEPIKVGDRQVVLEYGKAMGLTNFPDEAVSYLQFSPGGDRLWIDSGEVGCEGCMFLAQTKDLISLSFLPKPEPNPVPAYDPTDPGSDAFDADYAGAGTVIPNSERRELLMIYHGENHRFGARWQTTPNFYCTVGLATSKDEGLTWSRAGAIISGVFRKPASPATGGACNPTAISAGGFLYTIYGEFIPGSGSYALARAPLSSNGAPGKWRKYYNGEFSSDALNHGPYSPLQISGLLGIDEANVTFNRYLNAFLLLVPVGKDYIQYSTSQDLISWSGARVFLHKKPDSCTSAGGDGGYPSLITPGETASQITDQTGFVYVSDCDRNGNRGMYRYPYAIGSASLP